MERQELEAWLRLSATRGVGNVAARRLLAAFGSAEEVFRQSAAALKSHVSEAQSLSILTPHLEAVALRESTLRWLEAFHDDGLERLVVPLGHPLYPAALLDIDDPPLLLYVMGAPAVLSHASFPVQRDHALAVVGSRNPTPQGADNARSFSAALRTEGFCVVSGLATGIDAAAHEGALDAPGARSSAATIAVVGTGLDRVYPSRHRDLARRIASSGLLMSEYPIGTPPLAANFPKRNRLISGLSRGVLVVEAAPASGSLITARMACEQGRDVFAIPGSIHAIQSRGCHALIKQGAKLVETLEDILEEIPPFIPPTTETFPADRLVEAQSPLLEALGFDPVGLDTLQARTGFATSSLQVQLLELELEGHVARLPGGTFQRVVRA